MREVRGMFMGEVTYFPGYPFLGGVSKE